ncbi:MAG: ribonuclease D [Clostridiales bacterium]|nr:ribonuclease D [Clostridiales bacterium]
MKAVELNRDYVARINLKTDCDDRSELLRYCLGHPDEQYLAIGWSHVYENNHIESYGDYYQAVRARVTRINHALNLFADTRENDLFWTRDLDGCYWICRVKSPAEAKCILQMDIGAVLSVEAYKCGLEVPGQIKASFNRPRGGICEEIRDSNIVEYSKYTYNRLSGTAFYYVNKTEKENFLANLPDFELEELVISYLQIVDNYYVLSNSIANKSTTVKIECVLHSRNAENPRKAVVQVKAKKAAPLRASDFREFVEQGFYVYLYCPDYIDDLGSDKVVQIKDADLLEFAEKYESVLPQNILQWRTLFQ